MIVGHYVPQLAALVLDYNKQSHGKPIKLKAIAVNDTLLIRIACFRFGSFLRLIFKLIT